MSDVSPSESQVDGTSSVRVRNSDLAEATLASPSQIQSDSAGNASNRPQPSPDRLGNVGKALALLESERVQILATCARLDFFGRIAEPDANGCRRWTGGKNSRGYGKVYLGGPPGKFYLAHRVAWFIAKGEIPAGMTLDHACMVRDCAEVGHLEIVSVAENNRRAADARLRNLSAEDRAKRLARRARRAKRLATTASASLAPTPRAAGGGHV